MNNKILFAIVLFIVLVLIFILIMIIMSFKKVWNKDLDEKKIMYEKCKNDCGDGLTCDYTGVCKLPKNSSCSTDEDCTGNLSCVNWICVDNKYIEWKDLNIEVKEKKKKVSWI